MPILLACETWLCKCYDGRAYAIWANMRMVINILLYFRAYFPYLLTCNYFSVTSVVELKEYIERRDQKASNGRKKHKEGIKRHRKASKNIKRHRKVLKNIERHQKTSKGIKRHPKACQGIPRHPKAS